MPPNNAVRFFDNASTTRCCEAALEVMRAFACESFGNPASSHLLGQKSARAIRQARQFFASHFNIEPDQVIFTGSGTEADNLAIYGVAMKRMIESRAESRGVGPGRILVSATEHPAVRKTALSLIPLGFEVELLPVDSRGQIDRTRFAELLTPETFLISIHQVNNIMGAVHPVEELAKLAKKKVPGVLFHTDAIQAFGRVKLPRAPSAIDMVSISGHKVEGPKGVGALIVLSKELRATGLRPQIWGGEQEGGMRSGTQSPGLISGFHLAAEQTVKYQDSSHETVRGFRDRFAAGLKSRGLLGEAGAPFCWNSPEGAVPHIVSLSLVGFSSGPLARVLEDAGCIVSTGSACSSAKAAPETVLLEMGLSDALASSAIRISFSSRNTETEVDELIDALANAIEHMRKLMGTSGKSCGAPARKTGTVGP